MSNVNSGVVEGAYRILVGFRGLGYKWGFKLF